MPRAPSQGASVKEGASPSNGDAGKQRKKGSQTPQPNVPPAKEGARSSNGDAGKQRKKGSGTPQPNVLPAKGARSSNGDAGKQRKKQNKQTRSPGDDADLSTPSTPETVKNDTPTKSNPCFKKHWPSTDDYPKFNPNRTPNFDYDAAADRYVKEVQEFINANLDKIENTINTKGESIERIGQFDLICVANNQHLTVYGGVNSNGFFKTHWILQTSKKSDQSTTKVDETVASVEKHFQRLVSSDVLHCLRKFHKKRQDWFLKGGTALNLHGVAEAGESSDIDIQTGSEETMRELMEALRLAIHDSLYRYYGEKDGLIKGHEIVDGHLLKILQSVETTFKIEVTGFESGKLSLLYDDINMSSMLRIKTDTGKVPRLPLAMGSTQDCLIHPWKNPKPANYPKSFNRPGEKGGYFYLGKFPVSKYFSYIDESDKKMRLLQLKMNVMIDRKVRTITLVDIVYPPRGGYVGMGGTNPKTEMINDIPVPSKEYLYEQLLLILKPESGASPDKSERAYKRARELLSMITSRSEEEIDEMLNQDFAGILNLYGGAKKTKKPAAKKPAAKKPAAKKPAAKKPAAKKPAAKKPAAKKA